MKILFPRDDCKAPQQYYTCASNGFKGCCSIDPCPSKGCPSSGGEDSTDSQGQPPNSKASATKSKDASGDQNSVTPTSTTTVQLTNTEPLSILTPTPSAIQAVPAPLSATQGVVTPQVVNPPPGIITSQPSSAQSQATSQQPASLLLGPATSSQSPFTIVVVSTVQTPTSNGIALAPTTLLVTTTANSLPGAASQTSSSAPSVVSGGAPSSNTSVIGGVVGGVGAVFIVAALLWFWFRRSSKKRKELEEEKAAHGHEDDPREQGIDAHWAGDVIAGYKGLHRGVDRQSKDKARESMAGSESTVIATGYGHNVEKRLPTPPVTPNRQAFTEDAVPCLDSTPVRPDFEMTGSSPDPTGFTPELSGVPAARQPAELSPNPERLRINNRSSAYSEVGNAGPRTPGGAVMRSNLNLTGRAQNRRAPNGAAPHVLSWMEYNPNGSPMTEATESSPTSGVWSSAASSTFVRNSGVSQDSSTPGCQRERRIKDGGGGLESIRDEPRT